jgi:hypothetical protein
MFLNLAWFSSSRLRVQTVQAVQPLRSVQSPTSFLPRDAGEDKGGGLNDWNILNGLNTFCGANAARD